MDERGVNSLVGHGVGVLSGIGERLGKRGTAEGLNSSNTECADIGHEGAGKRDL
jgi:hypothetical protein